jgi:hypothetical protein
VEKTIAAIGGSVLVCIAMSICAGKASEFEIIIIIIGGTW